MRSDEDANDVFRALDFSLEVFMHHLFPLCALTVMSMEPVTRRGRLSSSPPSGFEMYLRGFKARVDRTSDKQEVERKRLSADGSLQLG